MECVLSSDVMVEDVDAARARLEQAGLAVLAERTFARGRKGLYFGKALAGMPVGIYDARDDAEARGA